MKTNWKIVLSAILVTGLAYGCIPEEGGGSGSSQERAAVDHETVKQSVSDFTAEAIDSIIEGFALMESSAMYSDYAASESCVVEDGGHDDANSGGESMDFDDSSGGEGEVECYSSGPSFDDMSAEYDEFIEILETRIFAEANVESENGDSVTYLLAGDVVCDVDDFSHTVCVDGPDGTDCTDETPDEPEGYTQCVEDVDAMEIRLEAILYEGGPLTIDVLPGADEIHPLTFALSSSEVSVTANLDHFKDAADHIADVVDEDSAEFPETFSGQVKAGYYAQGQSVRLAVDILQDLEIKSDEFDLYVEGVGEVLGFGVDLNQEVFEAVVGFGEIKLNTEIGGSYSQPPQPEPVEDGDYDGDDGYDEPEEEDPVDFALELSGLTSTMQFDPEEERVEWSDVGLGNGPVLVSINGETVIDIDLSAGMGGMFDAVMQVQEAGLEYSVEPGVELDIAFMFHRVVDEFDDFEDWMLDDVLTLALEGDANPAVLLGDYGVEVLRGQLRMESHNTDAGATVGAGMCVVDSDVDYEAGPVHPFDSVEAGQCTE